jgi:hypothetical protein
MDLTPPVAHMLYLLEAALRTLGPYSLTDGSVFVLDQAASAPSYQRFVLANLQPTQLAVWVEVTMDSTSFYLDRSAGVVLCLDSAAPHCLPNRNRLALRFPHPSRAPGEPHDLAAVWPHREQVRQFIYPRGLGAFWVRQRHFILYTPVFATTGSRTG